MMDSIKQTFLVDPHIEDFTLFSKYVEEKKDFTLHKSKNDVIKGIYRKIYYYNLLINEIYDLSDDNFKFLKESIGDLTMAMELFNMNYLKPSKMALRSSIEQFHRFLLLKHGQFEMGLSVRDIHRKVKELFDNLTLKSLISTLLSDYKQLCNFVHVEESNDFSKNLVLSSYQDFESKKVNKLNNELQRITETFCILIIIIDKDAYSRISKYNRLLVENSLSKTLLDKAF